MPPSAAFVISLDFELHWGVRHRYPTRGYGVNLLGARLAMPRILDLFAEFDVAATWATVGFLFARSEAERERFAPVQRPSYRAAGLSPYEQRTGKNETADPLHYGPTLIDRIRLTPRQELASHTFSHYFCLEPGQTAAEFRADLCAAILIAAARGVRLTSIVFPRNQHNPAYDTILRNCGITAYRGNPPSRMWRFVDGADGDRPIKRMSRLLDSYVPVDGHNTQAWREIIQPSGLCDVRASAFLRPYDLRMRHLEPLRLRRIAQALRHAAERGEIFHLWWHPHNFGAHTDENIAMLRAILTEYARCRERYGMQSMSMAEVAQAARSLNVRRWRPIPKRQPPLAVR
jgi:peptidoglycan/xylan/chitin deacetylase (PgdA/CDA1 family)